MKRGASAIVAWVLLLGFTIALATTIFFWTKTQAESMTESTIDYVSGQVECQDVGINVALNGNTLSIRNKGYFTVNKIIARTNTESQTLEIGLKPQQETTVDVTIDISNGLEIIPVVNVSKKEVGCADKAVDLNLELITEEECKKKDELCNGVDDNCNDLVDEGDVCSLVNYYCDSDSDTYFDKAKDGSCSGYNCLPAGCQVAVGDDCGDSNAAVHPGATEICNSLDDDCNGIIDDPANCAVQINLNNGLILLMHMDDNSYPTVIDSSGYVNYGTYHNTTPCVGVKQVCYGAAGKFGNALKFVENYQDYVNTTAINISSNKFTVSAWVYPFNTQNVNDRIIEQRYDTSFFLGIDGSNASKYRFMLTSLNSVTGGSVKVKNWQMVTGVYNSTAIILYVDGQKVGDKKLSSSLTLSVNDMVYISRQFNSAANFWNGSIDEVAIWNRDLSASELQALYLSISSPLEGKTLSCKGTATPCAAMGDATKCGNQKSCKFNVITVRVNSAASKTCNLICTTSGEICTDVGTDTLGTDNTYWDNVGGVCTKKAGNDCTLALDNQGLTCSGYMTRWTYCKCQLSGCSGTPVACSTYDPTDKAGCLAHAGCSWS